MLLLMAAHPPFRAPAETEVHARPDSCNLLEDQIDDPLLEHPTVTEIFAALAGGSNWHRPLRERKELGGYIVERNGRIGFVDYVYLHAPNPCSILHDPETLRDLLNDPATTVLAQVHTHAVHYGVFPNPGNCHSWKLVDSTLEEVHETPAPFVVFRPGPSQEDIAWWAGSYTPFTGYLIDPEQLYRWEGNVDPLDTSPIQPESFALEKGKDSCF
jgi:hypothetical protein